jgi:hypothetical protein
MLCTLQSRIYADSRAKAEADFNRKLKAIDDKYRLRVVDRLEINCYEI